MSRVPHAPFYFLILTFYLMVAPMEQSIESFIRYLAVERGLSDNYQVSTQRSLNDFASWVAEKNRGPRLASGPEWPTARRAVRGQREKTAWRGVTLPLISESLAEKKQ